MGHNRAPHPSGSIGHARHHSSRPLINENRVVRDVIVLGASAGGIEVLIRVLAELPADLPALISIVVHRAPDQSQLAEVLGQRAGIRVMEASNRLKLMHSRVYIAPPDHHLELSKDRMQIRRSPKEHSTRPAIDPLFRSAAQAFGRRVVGVLLSGGGDEGVNGLILIKQNGGISLTQDPADAPVPFLPLNAVRYDHPDCLLSTEGIASTLIALVKGQAVEC
jgi:two-component system chemotaxis response regulator CheB